MSLATLVLAAIAISSALLSAQAQEPIKIGFSVSLTGGLASSGKAHLMSKQIWVEEINAKGGLLGRQVKLVYYDDQTNAATLPGIYAKLIDIDKVDLLMGHATNSIVAAMPLIIERKKLVMVLLALGSNSEFKYSRYFQSAAFGPDSQRGVLSNNFFEVAKTLKPEPKTVALVGADAEFSNNVLIGARVNAKKFNLRIVYDRSYPPATVDYAPIVRAIQATNPDVVLLASYPPDSVGMVRAATEVGLKAQLFGGAMVGMQYASLMQQLSEKLNRVVNYHLYVPSAKMNFPGIEGFLKKYQAQAKDAGTDPLGFYQPPFAYAADAGPGAGDQGNRQPQRRQARRPYSQEPIQHDRGRGPFQRARRMGDRAHAGRAVPERAGQRARSIHDWPQAGHPVSAGVQGRRAGSAVREVANSQ